MKLERRRKFDFRRRARRLGRAGCPPLCSLLPSAAAIAEELQASICPSSTAFSPTSSFTASMIQCARSTLSLDLRRQQRRTTLPPLQTGRYSMLTAMHLRLTPRRRPPGLYEQRVETLFLPYTAQLDRPPSYIQVHSGMWVRLGALSVLRRSR